MGAKRVLKSAILLLLAAMPLSAMDFEAQIAALVLEARQAGDPVKEIKALLQKLGDDDFGVRERASADSLASVRAHLDEPGFEAALRKLAGEQSDAEVKERLGGLLARYDSLPRFSVRLELEQPKADGQALMRAFVRNVTAVDQSFIHEDILGEMDKEAGTLWIIRPSFLVTVVYGDQKVSSFGQHIPFIPVRTVPARFKNVPAPVTLKPGEERELFSGKKNSDLMQSVHFSTSDLPAKVALACMHGDERYVRVGGSWKEVARRDDNSGLLEMRGLKESQFVAPHLAVETGEVAVEFKK
jgi:hypothetical protein